MGTATVGGVTVTEQHEVGAGTGTEEEMSLELIDPSPLQRRTFGPEKLVTIAELAASMKSIGLLSAILLRPSKQHEGRFEVVCGERRCRAGRLNEWESIRVTVKELTDDEANTARVAENLLREDLTPFEEAAEMETMRATRPEITYQEISDELGLDLSRVARSMQLTKLIKPWRDATVNPESAVHHWPGSFFGYIARFPDDTQAGLASRFLTKKGHYNEASYMTLTELKSIIGEDAHVLDAAPWDLDDVKLDVAAGACSACPMRSSHRPELWDAGDIPLGYDESKCDAGADRCLNAECWDRKREAFLLLKALELEEKEGTILYVRAQSSDNDDVPKSFHGKTVAHYELTPCKKKDDGAMRVLHVSGSKVGKTEWARPTSHSAKKVAEKPPATPLKDRRAKLDAKRRLWVVGELLALAEFKQDTPIARFQEVDRDLSTNEMLAFAFCFGLSTGKPGEELYSCDSVWAKLEAIKGEGTNVIASELFKAAFPVLIQRLKSMKKTKYAVDDAELEACAAFLGADLKGLQVGAEEKHPVPKSWANLTAAGTPKATKKKAATKKQKTPPKRKAAAKKKSVAKKRGPLSSKGKVD